jgi:hypothetical protein
MAADKKISGVLFVTEKGRNIGYAVAVPIELTSYDRGRTISRYKDAGCAYTILRMGGVSYLTCYSMRKKDATRFPLEIASAISKNLKGRGWRAKINILKH